MFLNTFRLAESLDI